MPLLLILSISLLAHLFLSFLSRFLSQSPHTPLLHSFVSSSNTFAVSDILCFLAISLQTSPLSFQLALLIPSLSLPILCTLAYPGASKKYIRTCVIFSLSKYSSFGQSLFKIFFLDFFQCFFWHLSLPLFLVDIVYMFSTSLP